MKVELIYATWPNSPGGIGWSGLAEAVRKARLKAGLKRAGLDVTEHVLVADGPAPGELRAGFELAGRIGERVKACHEAGGLAVILCGSCSIAALGAISGLGGEDTGILWLDAHPDLNTPDTTMSGLFEGMAAAIVLGDAWQGLAHDVAGLSSVSRRDLCFYGVRDIDPAEQALMDDDAIPVAENAEAAIGALEHCARIYIHLDMDVHHAAELRVNRFSGEGGPSPKQVREDLTAVAAALPVAAIAITGIDPEIGKADGAIACAAAHIKAVCLSQSEAI